MDQRLRDFLTRDFEKMPIDAKQNFLRLLKQNPEKFTQVIRENFLNWATVAAFKIEGGSLIVDDVNRESAELTKHCQEYFAKELQKI
jgi:hypothetical protein